MKLERFEENPIIYPGMEGLEEDVGENICGPTLIKVPSWVKNPLGKYYLYFAHHKGEFIRLAYSDSLEGPWKIYKEGAVNLKQVPCVDHIASPEIYLDNENGKICLYVHGKAKDQKYNPHIQLTFVGSSEDGINFNFSLYALGPYYFRVFTHNERFYAIAKDKPNGGLILESDKYNQPFEIIKENIFPNMRHCGILKRENFLYVF